MLHVSYTGYSKSTHHGRPESPKPLAEILLRELVGQARKDGGAWQRSPALLGPGDSAGDVVVLWRRIYARLQIATPSLWIGQPAKPHRAWSELKMTEPPLIRRRPLNFFRDPSVCGLWNNLIERGMDINKYRHLCRLQIAGCVELNHAHKVVLMTLTDYINRHSFIAWPDFDTLGENCDVDRSTVIRAINEGRRLGHIVRIRRGGRRGNKAVSNQYVFRLHGFSDAPRVADQPSQSGTPATKTSVEHLIYSVVAAPYVAAQPEDSRGKGRKGVAERGATIKAECFRLVRENYGESRIGLVVRALEVDFEDDVLADIRRCISLDADIGEALYRPWEPSTIRDSRKTPRKILRSVLKIFAQSWGVPLKPVIELWQHGHLEMVEQDGGVGMAMAFPGDDKAPLLPLSLGDRAEGVSRGGEWPNITTGEVAS
jgi:hypothetical protein